MSVYQLSNDRIVGVTVGGLLVFAQGSDDCRSHVIWDPDSDIYAYIDDWITMDFRFDSAYAAFHTFTRSDVDIAQKWRDVVQLPNDSMNVAVFGRNGARIYVYNYNHHAWITIQSDIAYDGQLHNITMPGSKYGSYCDGIHVFVLMTGSGLWRVPIYEGTTG